MYKRQESNRTKTTRPEDESSRSITIFCGLRHNAEMEACHAVWLPSPRPFWRLDVDVQRATPGYSWRTSRAIGVDTVHCGLSFPSLQHHELFSEYTAVRGKRKLFSSAEDNGRTNVDRGSKKSNHADFALFLGALFLGRNADNDIQGEVRTVRINYPRTKLHFRRTTTRPTRGNYRTP